MSSPPHAPTSPRASSPSSQAGQQRGHPGIIGDSPRRLSLVAVASPPTAASSPPTLAAESPVALPATSPKKPLKQQSPTAQSPVQLPSQHSISNDDDEVILPQRSRAPSNPSVPSQSALGMTWNANNASIRSGKAITPHSPGSSAVQSYSGANSSSGSTIHTRRKSATATSWRANNQQITQQKNDHSAFDAPASYYQNPSGRAHTVSVNHAAELMNVAARKMAQKEQERSYSGHYQPRSTNGQDSSGADEEGEEYDHFQLPKIRARSKSISYDPVTNKMNDMSLHNEADDEITDLAAIWSRVQANQAGGNTNSTGQVNIPPGSQSNGMGTGSVADSLPHRRSSTFTYNNTPWDPNHQHQPNSNFASLPSSPDRLDRLRSQRRFSASPTVSSGEDYMYNPPTNRPPPGMEQYMSPRRHSVGGGMAYHAPGRYLSDAFTNLNEEPHSRRMSSQSNSSYGQLRNDMDDYYDVQDGSGGGGQAGGRSPFSDVGRGVPLHALPSNTNLYIVEFKAGRSDIFYLADPHAASASVKKGDLVIVEADRGKDLGKVINDAITPYQIHMLQAQQSDALSELHRVNREIHPKRIYRLAQSQEVTMLVTKSQDEAKAMAVCQTKVRQKKLPMEVVDGEYQWDRRKLTFYFIADRRIDFRELVRDLFKIYKTRIWMCAVNPVSGSMSPIFPASMSPNMIPPTSPLLPNSAVPGNGSGTGTTASGGFNLPLDRAESGAQKQF